MEWLPQLLVLGTDWTADYVLKGMVTRPGPHPSACSANAWAAPGKAAEGQAPREGLAGWAEFRQAAHLEPAGSRPCPRKRESASPQPMSPAPRQRPLPWDSFLQSPRRDSQAATGSPAQVTCSQGAPTEAGQPSQPCVPPLPMGSPPPQPTAVQEPCGVQGGTPVNRGVLLLEGRERC